MKDPLPSKPCFWSKISLMQEVFSSYMLSCWAEQIKKQKEKKNLFSFRPPVFCRRANSLWTLQKLWIRCLSSTRRSLRLGTIFFILFMWVLASRLPASSGLVFVVFVFLRCLAPQHRGICHWVADIVFFVVFFGGLGVLGFLLQRGSEFLPTYAGIQCRLCAGHSGIHTFPSTFSVIMRHFSKLPVT